MIFFILSLTASSIFIHLPVNAVDESFLWNRWESRTVDCVSSGRKDDCRLIEPPTSKNPLDPKKFRCRREPMPQTTWNTLASNSTTRLACPINCPVNFDLSVLQKKPYVNTNCQKYYTYGKYWDAAANDWFIWMTEPCVAAISTHCRFNDVPSTSGKGEEKQKPSTNKFEATQKKESENRKVVAA